jgi:hypothetical protein
MAVEAIGNVSGAVPSSATAPAHAARRGGDADSKDSTIVISRVTKTNQDGSTTTTITYADGHTKVETTPPKFSAGENSGAQSQGTEGDGRVTAVDILA